MINRPDTNAQRLKRHKRVRGKISGTPERPRLNVFRSNTNIYAQVIDDVTGKTLVSASSLEKGFEGKGSDCEAAKKVAEFLAFFKENGLLPVNLKAMLTPVTVHWDSLKLHDELMKEHTEMYSHK